jgi:hypothetical protein
MAGCVVTADLPPDGYAYGTATTITDLHTSGCSGCTAGACGRADDLMEVEYRRIEEWRTADPVAADTYDRATWPTT